MLVIFLIVLVAYVHIERPNSIELFGLNLGDSIANNFGNGFGTNSFSENTGIYAIDPKYDAKLSENKEYSYKNPYGIQQKSTQKTTLNDFLFSISKDFPNENMAKF